MISILIPTMNRSDFVIRALYYYYKVGFKGYICIGDSSKPQHSEKIKCAIKRLEGKLKIIYEYYANPPYLNDSMCLKELIELAPTPYAVYSGDDDFVIPRNLEKCAVFLENNPDYSAAHGRRVEISFKSGDVYGELAWLRAPAELVLESEKPSRRWIGYMRYPISTQYYVHRTDTWRTMYKHVDSTPIRYFGTEVLPCSFSALSGKIKEINCLSSVFQMNDNRVFGWDTHSMYSLIIDKAWSPSMRIFRKSLIEALVELEGMDIKEAEKLLDKELWRHILMFLQSQYNNRYPELSLKHTSLSGFGKVLNKICELVDRSGFLRKASVQDNTDPNKGLSESLSLDNVLNPSSPFHDDFMPVYQVITKGLDPSLKLLNSCAE